MKNKKMISQGLIGLSAVAVVLSGVGYMGRDILFASTQWLLVAALLALFAVYIKTEN